MFLAHSRDTSSIPGRVQGYKDKHILGLDPVIKKVPDDFHNCLGREGSGEGNWLFYPTMLWLR